jgi:hypothetical protein
LIQRLPKNKQKGTFLKKVPFLLGAFKNFKSGTVRSARPCGPDTK